MPGKSDQSVPAGRPLQAPGDPGQERMCAGQPASYLLALWTIALV